MSDINYIDKPLRKAELKKIAEQRFGDMVKAVIDIERGVMAVGGELHADEEAFLIQKGSEQKNLWGINLYPGIDMPSMLEFDSMINVRPSQGNRSRDVENPEIRKKITELVQTLIV
jgi:hypothetical protein